MDNWLLIIVATVFLVCIVVGYIRGFLKLGLSLLSTVADDRDRGVPLSLCGRCLAKYTPVDDFIEERCVAAFMPEISQVSSQISISAELRWKILVRISCRI